MYTKTQERVKVIEVFLFERCILRIETAKISARTHEEPNAIFNDFAISREPFDKIDSNLFYFKSMDLKTTPKPIGSGSKGRFPKLEPNESYSSYILVFKLNNQSNISKF